MSWLSEVPTVYQEWRSIRSAHLWSWIIFSASNTNNCAMGMLDIKRIRTDFDAVASATRGCRCYYLEWNEGERKNVVSILVQSESKAERNLRICWNRSSWRNKGEWSEDCCRLQKSQALDAELAKSMQGVTEFTLQTSLLIACLLGLMKMTNVQRNSSRRHNSLDLGENLICHAAERGGKVTGARFLFKGAWNIIL